MLLKINIRFIILVFSFLMVDSAISQSGALRYFELGYRGLPDSINPVFAIADAAALARIDRELEKPESERRLQISGRVDRGTRYNNPNYHWHFVPGTISLRLPDGTGMKKGPRYVEARLDEWLTYGARYRPAGVYIKRELTPDVTDELVTRQTISIFPNPADEKVFVQLADFPHPVEQLVLYDNAGHALKLWSPATNPGTMTLEVASLAPGYYTLSVRGREKRWARQLLIK